MHINPDVKILELGGGDNPMPGVSCNVDVRPGPHTSFTANFDEPLPIQSDEWDAVVSRFTIEHLGWRYVRQFVSEVFRVLKPGGSVLIITANVEAQVQWIKDHAEGWDGKPAFESASCILFGDQDYSDNTHKNYMSPDLVRELFLGAGFENVVVSAFGERQTDLRLDAKKPAKTLSWMNGISPGTGFGAGLGKVKETVQEIEEAERMILNQTNKNKGDVNNVLLTPVSDKIVELRGVQESYPKKDAMPPAEMYDKHYFNGGGKVGGYAREGYWDYPVHHVTAKHILDRKPSSVLELGCARGYILKRVKDAGVPGFGIEVSKHCHMTRVTEGVFLRDMVHEDWPFGQDYLADLCYSVAVLEHVPEHMLPRLFENMKKFSRRGLHGIDFGHKDDGFDKTHCCLHDQKWWRAKFDEYGLQSHEVVDKEDLEKGAPWPGLVEGDGKVKLNVGSCSVMFHHGWENIDILDLGQWAANYQFKFRRLDVRNGLPYDTGSVDAIMSSHMLEHLSYFDGLRFLRECRRVLKPSGVIRILVPDARMLMERYVKGVEKGINAFEEFDHINDECEKSKSNAARLHCLMNENHLATYDEATLHHAMLHAGFDAITCSLHSDEGMLKQSAEMSKQVLRETHDMFPCLSLIVAGVPRT